MIYYGVNGWYWELPNGKLAIVVTSARLLNKFFPRHDHKYPSGSEVTVYLSKKEFTKLNMVRKLKVDKTKQKELQEYHDKKYSKSPLPAPSVRELG